MILILSKYKEFENIIKKAKVQVLICFKLNELLIQLCSLWGRPRLVYTKIVCVIHISTACMFICIHISKILEAKVACM